MESLPFSLTESGNNDDTTTFTGGEIDLKPGQIAALQRSNNARMIRAVSDSDGGLYVVNYAKKVENFGYLNILYKSFILSICMRLVICA